MRRRAARRVRPRSAVRSWPSSVTVPVSGSSRPTSIRARVVLPQPDSPTRPSDSPRRSSRLTLSTALIRARPPPVRPEVKVFDRPLALRMTLSEGSAAAFAEAAVAPRSLLSHRSAPPAARKHAACRPGATVSSNGRSSRQRSTVSGQRGANEQPGRIWSAGGGLPVITRRSPGPPCGTESRRARVYGCAGPASTSAAEPASTTRPAYMTQTSLATSDATPRSCVISRIARSISRWRDRSKSRICACTVTSSAVVGSSAISRLGRSAMAMAIRMRCRIPPEHWCGKSRTRRAGSGMPTCASSFTASSRALRRLMPRCSRNSSPIWLPTDSTGFSADSGSWKTIATFSPRTFRSSAGFACRTSTPPTSTASALVLASDGSSPMTARPVMDFPAPDSPSSTSVSPRRTCRSTPRTAYTVPLRWMKSTVSPETRSTSGCRPAVSAVGCGSVDSHAHPLCRGGVRQHHSCLEAIRRIIASSIVSRGISTQVLTNLQVYRNTDGTIERGDRVLDPAKLYDGYTAYSYPGGGRRLSGPHVGQADRPGTGLRRSRAERPRRRSGPGGCSTRRSSSSCTTTRRSSPRT